MVSPDDETSFAKGERKREIFFPALTRVAALVVGVVLSLLEKEKKNLKKKICPFPSFFLPYRADPRQHVASKLQVRVHLRLRRRHADVALVDAQRARPLRPRVGELVGLVRRRRDDAGRGLARGLVVDAVELDLIPLLRGLVVFFVGLMGGRLGELGDIRKKEIVISLKRKNETRKKKKKNSLSRSPPFSSPSSSFIYSPT